MDFYRWAFQAVHTENTLSANKGGSTTFKFFTAWHTAERIRFFHWSRVKVQQNPRDRFSNVEEYFHCLNCKLYFNGHPQQRYANTAPKHPGALSACNNNIWKFGKVTQLSLMPWLQAGSVAHHCRKAAELLTSNLEEFHAFFLIII